jgi:hypothetical protein
MHPVKETDAACVTPKKRGAIVSARGTMPRFSFSMLCATLSLLSACASEPPPAASIAAKPVAVTGSFCDGLIEGACTKMAGCQWAKRASVESKQGRPLSDYCRAKIVAAATK